MLVYIKPLSIFPELHSDTIFGAILRAISELYPEKVEELVSKFQRTPPFIISSSFPYFQHDENNKIRFFPKIIKTEAINDNLDSENSDHKKEFKKIDFIEENLFFKLASGDIDEKDIINNLNNNYNIEGNLLTKKDLEIKGRYKKTITPNNTINRITLESEAIFYSEGLKYNNMGVFFLIDFFEEEYKKIIIQSIKFLKDRGFGNDISTGKGHFDYEIDENYNLKENNDGDYFISLSRFIPNADELSKINKFSAYEIDSKRGKSSDGELRKQVKFFKEGSTFPHYKKSYGRIIKSGKNSPAIEYGYAFPVKILIKG